ncbi:T-cell activation inhibitor; mitochondrial [Camelus dromedarius]|uniref:T-cell activation inhibitor n=1 Tax=Camelus dromedarius TaxID=9838 RepID=A0A5N4CYV4_CAMDR|nr:T-cell activation inhibitor; mitochondrial [Camelus dromedarius]
MRPARPCGRSNRPYSWRLVGGGTGQRAARGPLQESIDGCPGVDLHMYSEMFCHLRPVRRHITFERLAEQLSVHQTFGNGDLGSGGELCLGKIFPYWFLYSRALSGAEAVNALRPFYFAVHPDFFGQHPREREVNENSLKRLSAYLENLQKPGFKSLKPTQLMFYVRERDQNSSDGQEHFSTSVPE